MLTFFIHVLNHNAHGRKVSWIVKRFGQYERKASWIVKRYESYGGNMSWIVKRFGKYRRKLWNDMENTYSKNSSVIPRNSLFIGHASNPPYPY
jgi:hypothetical protein